MREISTNLRSFFRKNGRTLILPIDHGTAIPVPGLEQPRELLAAVNPFYDGYVVNYGLARAAEGELISKAVCLRTDVYKPACAGHADRGSYRVYGAEDAKRVGAQAVMNMLFVHHPEEDRLFAECASLISECHKVGLPVMIEALPMGIGQPAAYTADNIRFAVRAAAELGADVVKTAYPGDRDAFAGIVSECVVPVIVLGGAATSEEAALFQMVRGAVDAGAAGIAIGRHVWQHSRPERMARALHDLVHTDAEVALALSMVRL